MNIQHFNISVQGASHIKKEQECQDASYSFKDDEKVIAIVADGHGSAEFLRSAMGSEIATIVGSLEIKKFLEKTSFNDMRANSDEKLLELQKSITASWNEQVRIHYENNSFTIDEIEKIPKKFQKDYLAGFKIEKAYGTTFIAIVITNNYWFGIHIGDGKCVAVSPDGRFLQPIPWDKKCFLNATTSICDDNALDNFRSFYSEKLPVAIFIGTDGVDDCFTSNELLHKFYKTVLYSFSHEEFSKAKKELYDYLPRLSAKGSGDDISIAAIMNMDLIGEIDDVKEYDVEKEKLKVDESKRREKEKHLEEKEIVDARYEQMLNESTSSKSKNNDLITDMEYGVFE